MKIGELATQTHIAVETIRYYERLGLLPVPPRSGGNYRVYGPQHLQQLAFIRHCRSLDMTLDEVRVLLRAKNDASLDCSEVNALLDHRIAHVAARIKALRGLQKQLQGLRSQCTVARDSAHCGILSGLSQPGLAGQRPAARKLRAPGRSAR